MKIENLEAARNLINQIDHVKEVIAKLKGSTLITISESSSYDKAIEKLDNGEFFLDYEPVYKTFIDTDTVAAIGNIAMSICIKGLDAENNLAMDFKNKIIEAAEAFLAELEAKLIEL